jgi:hypothetical protein
MGKNKGLVEELETRPALDPEHLCAGGVNGDDVSNSVNTNPTRLLRHVNRLFGSRKKHEFSDNPHSSTTTSPLVDIYRFP